MRGGIKCGIIHGVIFYQMVTPEVFANEANFKIQSDVKAQVVDLSSSKDANGDLTKILESGEIGKCGLSLCPCKKVTKNSDFLNNFTKNVHNIEVLYIDEEFLNQIGLDLATINTTIYLTLSPKTDPREYEAKFAKYQSMGITGINFDIETLSKGYLALCDKFNLKKCAHSIEFERQLEKAKNLDLDAAIV